MYDSIYAIIFIIAVLSLIAARIYIYSGNDAKFKLLIIPTVASVVLSINPANHDAFLSSLLSYFAGVFVVMSIWEFAAKEHIANWFNAIDDDPNHVRGSSVASHGKVIKQMRKAGVTADLSLAGLPVPNKLEPYHFLFAGATGTGKSVAFIEMMDKIIKRANPEEKVIVVDAGGGFYSRYANNLPTPPVLFNVFDKRSVDWSPFAEMRYPWDADSLATSIIPSMEGEAGQFNGFAQTFLSVILLRLFESGRATNGDLFHYVCVASVEELRVITAGTAAAPLVEEGNERLFGSVKFVASNALKPFSYLSKSAGREAFSFRRYAEGEGNQWAFITFQDDQLAALKPIVSTILDVVSKVVLSQKPSQTRRTWLIIDECASLNKITSLADFLTKARKSGGCAVIGLQNIDQFRQNYGHQGANVLLSCLSSWLILRVGDGDTAEYMSKTLGDQEVWRTSTGKNHATGLEFEDKTSENTSIQRQRTVLASEIQHLTEREGYLMIGGAYDIVKISLDIPVTLPNPAEPIEAIEYTPQAHKQEEEAIPAPATISNAYLPFDLPEDEEDHEPEV
ncbi:type IV secretion system DNA-binding domain-containing protein [Sulfuriferula nivalis]|uniref:Type IV secretion system coupling protein TraD DNA-binding domain-containing protein n=1 Tax=Sulfuriferula nivalis TaxID=2675298 RepID=A0A809RFK7_9PROT|nr:type IV secretion system DNA-binding domain-containing protein [Sulfuriferula nivalis]BBP00375.1 hypothetical protein SFSGTM_10830 [Sulfuriferula nivalis]